jgi:hypothetical protein
VDAPVEPVEERSTIVSDERTKSDEAVDLQAAREAAAARDCVKCARSEEERRARDCDPLLCDGPYTVEAEEKVEKVRDKLEGVLDVMQTLEAKLKDDAVIQAVDVLTQRFNGLSNWASNMTRSHESLYSKLDLIVAGVDRDREERFKRQDERYETEIEDGLAYALFKEAWLLAIKGDDFAMDMTKGQSEIIANRSLMAAEAFVEQRRKNRKCREGLEEEQ